jgi:adenylate kinase family enzyme
MKAQHLQRLLATSLPHGQKVLIKGPPGVGKSDIVHNACEIAEFDLVLFHPAISDPTDYSGLPAKVTDKGEHYADFLPFGSLRKLIKAERPTAAFLDDIGQAPHAVQAALMQLILARRVNGHKISDQVVFVGATNDTTHRAGVHGLLEPVKSRWDTIVELEPDLNDWCTWAFLHDMPAELVAFLRFRPEMLCKFEPTKELTNSPSPRTAAAVGHWVNDGVTADPELAYEVIAGAAGEPFAAEFLGFLKVWQAMPSIDGILLDPQSAPLPTEPAAKYAVSVALAHRAAPDNFDRIISYLYRMEGEFRMLSVRDATRKTPDLTRTRAYTEWAVKDAKFLS